MDNTQLPPSIPPKKNRRAGLLPGQNNTADYNSNPPEIADLPPSFAPRRQSAFRQNSADSSRENPLTAGLTSGTGKSRFRDRGIQNPSGELKKNQTFIADTATKINQDSVQPRKTPVKPPKSLKKIFKRVFIISLIAVLATLAAAIAWPAWLIYSTEDYIKHMDALSTLPNTKGETWLIAGSDKRSNGEDGGVKGYNIGNRTDSLMLVRNAGGTSMIVSLPRDTVVEIPGQAGINKLNAAYAFGGPKLLVKTVEKLTGVKVDHYVEVSMGAVTQIIDTEGGVKLCYPDQVDDADSDLKWPGGCHIADGKTALAFSRMRYADPRGDFGRQERQRQVLSQMVNKAQSEEILYSPSKQKALAKVVAENLNTDPDTGIVTLGRLAWAYKTAQAAGLSGNPPIGDPNYSDGIHGSMVLLDKNLSADFWQSFLDGSLTKDQYHSFK